MTRNASIFISVLAVLFATACTDSHGADDTPPTKDQARVLGGSADGADLCEIWGWYGDGVCDDFCPLTDSDCGAPATECHADTDCAEHETCVPGDFCFHLCAAGDPSCCAGNTCESSAGGGSSGGEQTECMADADCDEGETCVPGDMCEYWCEAGDPSCCTGNTCEPSAGGGSGGGEENECIADADCPSGQSCIAGEFCYFWCVAGDPTCCVGNTCE